MPTRLNRAGSVTSDIALTRDLEQVAQGFEADLDRVPGVVGLGLVVLRTITAG